MEERTSRQNDLAPDRLSGDNLESIFLLDEMVRRSVHGFTECS
jgi:hypothetical protein